MSIIRFLSMAEILTIYEDQIRNYGGEFGVRDTALLSSAIAIPESTYGGEYLHKDIPEMAAAYAYHLSENHPFIDGNKRTALASALVFLDINGYEFDCNDDELYAIMMIVAQGKMKKSDLLVFFANHSKKSK